MPGVAKVGWSGAGPAGRARARGRGRGCRSRWGREGRAGGGDEGAAGGEAVGGGLGHGSGHDLVDRGGQVGAQGGDPGWGGFQVGEQDGLAGPARERRLAGQALVEDAAEGVAVGAAVHRAAGGLFGGRVPGGAEERPGAAEGAVVAVGPGQAEVDQVDVLGVAVQDRRGEQDVARLDVAVDQAAGVGGVQGPGHLVEDGQGAGRVEAALGLEDAPQVGGVDVAHGQVQQAAVLAGAVDGDDVGVVDGGGDPHLAQEPGPEVRVAGQGRGQQLERHRPAAEPGLLGPVDHAHAAAAGLLHDPVAGHHGPGGGVGAHRHLQHDETTPASRLPVKATRQPATARSRRCGPAPRPAGSGPARAAGAGPGRPASRRPAPRPGPR